MKQEEPSRKKLYGERSRGSEKRGYWGFAMKLKLQDMSFVLPRSRRVPNFCIFLKDGLPNFVSFRPRYFSNKGPSSQGYGFSSSHVWMWELDYKESWVLKNWCFWTVILEKTLEGPFDYKEIQLVHPKGKQSWIFIGRADAEAKTPVLWPPDAKNWVIGKDPDAGKDWRQEKGMTQEEMVGWHHKLNGHEFE